jgi:hypothetical protein
MQTTFDVSTLPAPVAAYFAANKTGNTELLEHCFASDAHVHDESHDYYGLDAIKTWQRDAQAKYQNVNEPLEASVNENTLQVRVRVTGNFPGSPIELRFLFTLTNDKITELEIQ